MRCIIHENERGLLFRHGRFERLLPPGRYFELFRDRIEVVPLDGPLLSAYCGLERLLKDPDIAAQTTAVTVADGEYALHYVNDRMEGCLPAGRHAFWSVEDRHTFRPIAIAENPAVEEDIPADCLEQIPKEFLRRFEVAPYQKARLYYNRRFVRLLDAGVYYFWLGGVRVDIEPVDTRLLQLAITGQELLTLDKVSLRVNCVCRYRITDYVRVAEDIDDYAEQLHVAAQLALRDYIGQRRLDDILEHREQLAVFLGERLREAGKALFLDVQDAGVRDIILPGEIRAILNTVLLAEKRAQANLITRREEVASTRSLLNTARMMEENQTLYKLKEMEYLEKICEKVGSITVNGGYDLLGQLTAILKGGESHAGDYRPV